jgi:hypothetical protein
MSLMMSLAFYVFQCMHLNRPIKELRGMLLSRSKKFAAHLSSISGTKTTGSNGFKLPEDNLLFVS